jgi:4-diphosphocytidyl-2-C-methyl-D-erythritol kinase
MRLLAPAKINLHLRVGEPRADGFHPLLTWMCTVGLFDTLDVKRTDPAPSQAELVRLWCDLPELPCDSGNLVVRAAETFAEAVASASNAWDSRQSLVSGQGGIEIRLLKRIPVGAGLGGGSSDGARVFMALNALWGVGWKNERLAELSATLGSDLPFFFHGPSAICRGRGERVEPLAWQRVPLALLILPGRPLPTAGVYKRFDEMKAWRSSSTREEPDWRQWAELGVAELLPRLANDLEPAAFSIDAGLGQLRKDVEQSLSRPVRMSGSGSSLFTLFESNAREDAQKSARMIEDSFGVRVVVTDLAVAPVDDLGGLTCA